MLIGFRFAINGYDALAAHLLGLPPTVFSPTRSTGRGAAPFSFESFCSQSQELLCFALINRDAMLGICRLSCFMEISKRGSLVDDVGCKLTLLSEACSWTAFEHVGQYAAAMPSSMDGESRRCLFAEPGFERWCAYYLSFLPKLRNFFLTLGRSF